MAELHDGDVYNINPGDNPIYAQFIDTDGRVCWRLVDKYGTGIAIERDAMIILHTLTGIALNYQSSESLSDFIKNHRGNT